MWSFPYSAAGVLRATTQSVSRDRFLLLCATGLGLTVATWMWWRKRDVELQQVGVVSQLLIYPVKSCRGVLVQEAECVELGLKSGELKDRHWLVVTEEGSMVTGRQEPRIVLISATVVGEYLCLSAAEMPEILVPLVLPKANAVRNCRVFGKDIQGRDCGEEVSDWLTSYFQSSNSYRLVHFEPEVMQPRKSKEVETLFRDKDVIAYPDASPIMLLSETSLEELNRRMDEPVSLANFRPCIVVSNCEAFAEDSWDEVKLGTTRLKRVMACGRCVLTTVNPNTGVITRKEPLDTLRTFRKSDPSLSHIYKTSPLFGQYYGVEQNGGLKVGDPVYRVIRGR
ncbi:hypothetical protein GDO86_019851 [Hymenochirus boettgeri]|uniref:MOSC domain-containing protein n=1 Tax=Hymenochirus boettgeri TaxID=247094 RepID=A0A8T2IJA5_9PIPI|nr:hypothetical protein GDO86_019851 [Hymenochirus boettgeri]